MTGAAHGNLSRWARGSVVASLIAATLVGPQAPVFADEVAAFDPYAPVTYYVQPAAAPVPPAVRVPVAPVAVPTMTLSVPPVEPGGPWRLSSTASELGAQRVFGGIDRVTIPTQPQVFADGTGGNLVYNGGVVQRTNSSSYTIFWRPTGSFMSAQYQPLINRYLSDVGGSSLYKLLTQYSDTVGSIQNASNLAGTWQDTSAYPQSVLTDQDIVNEVVRALNAQHWTPSNEANFFVYIASGEGECLPGMGGCFGSSFCGYHSAFTVRNGQGTVFPVRYAFVGYIDGSILQGCGPGAPYPNGDGPSDIGIKVTSHEHMEMVTDPVPPTAWVDSLGNEIADKCHVTYGPRDSQGADITLSGNPYLVQTEWSNVGSTCALSLPVPAAVCNPRPPVQVTTAPGAPGTLNVTISTSGINVSFLSLQLGNTTTNPAVPVNAVVDVGAQTGLSGPMVIPLPQPTTQINVVVHRAVAGAATTLPLVVTDSCSAWPTLVGGGPSAF